MKCRPVYSDAVIRKVADADFELVMESVNFADTPRATVTVGDMERHYSRIVFERREDLVFI